MQSTLKPGGDKPRPYPVVRSGPLFGVRARRLLVLCVAALALLAACEQALGIKKAELDPQGVSPCEQYCAEVTGNCVSDADKQYTDVSTCMGVCMKLPVGQPGDQFQNTVYCRLEEAKNAKAEPGTHCARAGPTGFDPRDARAYCGSNCEAFCEIFEEACPPEFDQYNGLGDCVADCETIPVANLPFNAISVNMTEGNTVQCRLYHVSAATTLPDLHCAHADGASPCVDAVGGNGGSGGSGGFGGGSTSSATSSSSSSAGVGGAGAN